MLPKVVFKKIDYNINVDIIKWTFNDDNSDFNLSLKTKHMFPNIKNKLDIREGVLKELSNKDSEIISSVTNYQKSWDSYNDVYIKALEDYFDIKWPSNYRKIFGMVGIMPIFPRYLDEHFFAVSYNMDNSFVVATTAHECCHFLYFEKWKELFPDYNKTTFDSPHLIWELSEMVIDVILNNKLFNDIFHYNFKSYDYFYENNKEEMDTIKLIYNNNNISDAIKKSYEYLLNKRKK